MVTRKIRKAIKIDSSPRMDDLVLGIENVSPVLQEASSPSKKNLTKLSTVKTQKSEPLNKQHPARPKVDWPHGDVAAVNDHETRLKKQNTVTNDPINNFNKNEKSSIRPTRIMSALTDEKIFNSELKNREKKLSSIQQNKNLTSDVKIEVNKNLLKTWVI